MPYRPHRLDPNCPGREVVTTKSPAPPIVVQFWCGMVEQMNRLTLDHFTRDICQRFHHRDLEPLRDAILRRRRRVRAMQLRPQTGLAPAFDQWVIEPVV